jgi:cellulose synthase operon protein B
MGRIMIKQFSKFFLTLLTCIFLLASMIDTAGAQTSTVTPTSPQATQSSTPAPTALVQLEGPDIVTFSQLRQGEIQLTGPYDSTSFSFAIPADWVLKDGAQLQLLMGVSFNTQQFQGDMIVVGGGTLTVFLNNIVLVNVPLNEVGDTNLKINIPLSSFATNRSDGRMSLRFVLDSGLSCRVSGLNTDVFIHSTSYLNLPHDVVQPSTSLVNFPRPIIQNSFFPDTAQLVIPDQPTAAELQAALTVAAGFGNLSSNRLALDMITMSGLNESLTKRHLIFVGKSNSLPVLSGLNLPLPLTGGQFQLSAGGSDDGLIEMINSPWSSPHVVLVVSANTDAGVVKAAQAISTGVIRPNQVENLSIIEQVNTSPFSGPKPVDQTLSDLGYETFSFRQRGESSEELFFNVPAGMTVSSEAYFDMVYGHSSLVDYNSSHIVVLLNDQPIGSVKLNDATSAVPTNHAKIMLPPSAVLPGINRLSVRVTLQPVNDCTPPTSQGLWVNLWSQSLIHLPLMALSLNPIIPQDLAAYPRPFIYNSTLGSTAFVLERNNLESWRNAMQVAFYLGYQAAGSLTQLSAFYGDEIPVAERSKYHLLIIGRPSKIPLVAEINEDLPAPFLNGKDIVSDSGSFQVTYRIAPDSPMGYIQTMLSPWNSENIVLAVLGNTEQGVTWASTALVDSTLRSQLGGNFAVVNDKQIISSDTRYVVASSGEIQLAAETPIVNSAVLSTPMVDVPATRNGWILPALIVSIGLIVIVVFVVTIQHRSRINARRTNTEEAQSDRADGPEKHP